MGKTEFLDKLRLALNGRLSVQEVSENMNYYEDYINTQMRLGHSEEEVITSLGDPRLIAKTIIGTNGMEQAVQETDAGADGEDGDYRARAGRRGLARMLRMPIWLWLLVFGVGCILVLGIIFSILSFLVPFVLPVVVVLFLVKLFRDWLN